nr:MAG TPA: HBS1 N-terminus [Caudoviricetes sp.]
MSFSTIQQTFNVERLLNYLIDKYKSSSKC